MSLVKGGDGRNGGYPVEPSPPSSSNGANGHSSKKSSHTHNELHDHKVLLKLEVKFDLPVYDGEMNAKKLDNLVKRIEFYYRG